MAKDRDFSSNTPNTLPPSERSGPPDDDFRLLGTEDFDGALRALEAFEGDASEEWEAFAEEPTPSPDDYVKELADTDEDEAVADEVYDETPESVEEGVFAPESEAIPETEPEAAPVAPPPPPAPARAARAPAATAFDDEERHRQPRAQGFRRRLRNQVGLLPMSLYLLALGAYLLARGQDAGDLPDFSTAAIGAATVLAAGFTVVFHAILNERRERGLLFFGLWLLITAGLVAGLVTAVDQNPDATEWWPLILASLGATLFVQFLIERMHDARLIWVAALCAVAAATAYGVTSGEIDQSVLDQAADYWPLLLSAVGIGLLPLAVRRPE